MHVGGRGKHEREICFEETNNAKRTITTKTNQNQKGMQRKEEEETRRRLATPKPSKVVAYASPQKGVRPPLVTSVSYASKPR